LDYYFYAAMEMITGRAVMTWLICALISAFFTFSLHKLGKIKSSTAILIPLFVFYLAFVLTITIIERTPTEEGRYQLELFWTIRDIWKGEYSLLREIFWNIVLFLPIGAAFSLILNKHSVIAFLIAIALSASIEFTQLMTHRGLFEWDDMIYNGFGALLGIGIIYLIRRMRKKF
jgi:glycopeptide antibiotics resistance protein